MAKSKYLYFEALKRLQQADPVIVPKGTKISNDAVSVEAGRKKGSIKRSRPEFSELIAAIKEAQSPVEDVSNQPNEKSSQIVKNSDEYRVKYETLLAERAGVILEAFRQREEIKVLRAALTARAVELANYVALAHNLEAELARLRGRKLQSVPQDFKKEDE